MQINFGARIIEPFASRQAERPGETVLWDVEGKAEAEKRIIRLNNDGLPHLDVYNVLTDDGERSGARVGMFIEPTEEEAKELAAIEGIQDLFINLPDAQLDKLVTGFARYQVLLQSRLGQAVERVLNLEDYYN